MKQFLTYLFITAVALMMFGGALIQNLPVAVSGMILGVGACVVAAVLALIDDAKLRKQKIKMYCICSKEALDKMKGIRGKMITQGGHAYLHAYWDAETRFPRLARAYRSTGHAYKITLVVPTETDLITLRDAYHGRCGVSLVKDAGFTVFKNEDGSARPTITFLGIGPIAENMMGDDLKALKTLT